MESAVIFPMARKQQKDPFLFFVVLLVLFLLFGLPLLKDQSSFRQIFTSDPAVQTSSSKTVKSESKSVSQTPSKKMTKESDHQRPPEEREAKFTDAVMVQKVIDGDTIELADGRHVRLIGIDTPESRKNEKAKRDSLRSKTDLDKIISMGLKAKKALTDLVGNRLVKLEYDVTKKDKYGRTLAYVYLVQPSDEIMHLPFEKIYQDDHKQVFVNATMIQNGFAQPMTYPPNVKYAETFKELFEEARVEKRGLWEEKEILVRDNPKFLF